MELSIPQTRDQAREVMEYLLSGIKQDEIVSFLHSRPISDARPEELLGYRDALWERKRKAEFGHVDLDIVGTGGVRKPRYNVSTTVTFVVAALGIRVAKHGNRGSVKRNGSFDLLEILLGVPLSTLTECAVETLETTGLTFLFARDWHPAFGAIAAARAEVGKPTVFNLLGPLLNPSKPVHKMVGCGDPQVANVVAKALSELGLRALVVTGSDGLDEITLAGSSQVIEVQPDNITTKQIVPEDFAMTTVSEAEIAGGDATANASEFKAIINGQGRKPLVDLVTLNAAFALSLVKGYSVDQAVNTVRTALADGTVAAFFQDFRQFVMTQQKVPVNNS